MGLMSRFLGHEHGAKRAIGGHDYIDLGEMDAGGDAGEVNCWVRVAELHKLDDFKEFAHHVYDGHVLVVDIRKIATDEILLRRFTNEARKVANDVRGDVAGIADGYVVITPAGVRVDKQKHRATARP